MNRPQHVFKRLEEIRILRNRISHHEPIFDIRHGLEQNYQHLRQTIAWLSTDGKAMLKSVCSFESVWQEKVNYF